MAPQSTRKPSVFPERSALVLLVLVATLLRFYRLTSDFPALTDEAIYMRWAEIIEQQNEWFVSLLDGKQPLSYWIYALLRLLSDSDPLLAARSVSAVAGGLTTLLIYGIGKRLAGPGGGLAGALCWAVFPWSMVYDRLALTEALVNLSGACIVYTALVCFRQQEIDWKKTATTAVAVGLAFLVKSTTLLFALSVVLIGLWLAPRPVKALLLRLGVIFLPLLLVFLFLQATIPDAPTHETHNVVLHHTSRFTSPAELARDPLMNVRENFPKLRADLLHYLPVPTFLFALAAFFYLAFKRSTVAVIVLAASIIPVAFQLFVLSSFTPRFAYPHIWPWLLAVGVCATTLWEQSQISTRPRVSLLATGAASVLVAGSMVLLTWRILHDPKAAIEPDDSGRFFGSYVHVAWGVPEAIHFLDSEAKSQGGFVLLTDPFWGVPADMAFAYLNGHFGIRVHEAWWLQLEGKNLPIMPDSKVDLLKSHYQRVKGGAIDFRDVRRVFYLTDTFYMSRRAVRARQPSARLLRSFPKPEGNEWVDVYRLK